MLRETRKRRTRERLSTNALHGGGSARSSDEGSVMELERRGRLGRWKERGNRKAGGPRSRNKGLAGLVAGWAEKSRMRRESHVRFCGGLGVEFPRATRRIPPGYPTLQTAHSCGAWETLVVWKKAGEHPVRCESQSRAKANR